MKKSRLFFYFIIFMLICQPLVAVSAVSKEQEVVISDHCEKIHEDLKLVQKNDARARVYMGNKYETVLAKFVVPLNLRLVENNLSSSGFINGQNSIVENKNKFAVDYVEYQQKLEELVGFDCKKEPGAFYEKLTSVRRLRQKINQDLQKMRQSVDEYRKLVVALKEKIK